MIIFQHHVGRDFAHVINTVKLKVTHRYGGEEQKNS